MPRLDQQAIDLLLKAIETTANRITNEVLDDHFPQLKAPLLGSPFLARTGDGATVAFHDDHDDLPVALSWSPERGGYGYFSPTAGWVDVEAARLAKYRVDITAVIGSLISKIRDRSGQPPMLLVDDLLWEVGYMRLAGRAKRLSVWFARRTHDPRVWKRMQEMMLARPAPDLRVLLTSTPAARLPAQLAHGHLVVPVLDVLEYRGGLVIDPAILAARINNPFGAPDQIVTHSADFGVVSIRGKDHRFTGGKQRALMRQLVPACQSGKPKMLTAQVLTEAGYKDSVNTLAKAFSGRGDWREFAAEADGFCWLVTNGSDT